MSRLQAGTSYGTPGARPAPYLNPRAPVQHSGYKQQAVRGVGGQGANGAYHSPRAHLRDKYARHFNGPAYLEVSNSNRHVLSLRSCVPCEVDWSLDRLMIISGNDPDLLRFDELAGLLDGLFNLVQAFLDATGGRDDFHARVFMSGEGDVVRRRATEAAMILRNLSTEKVNQAALLGYSKLAQVVTGALDQFEEEQSAMESTAEMRIYLLEILEIVGEKLPLVLPGRSLSREDGAEPEDLSSPSVRLFPLLVTLTRSSDRALVLASFRCLTALAVNNKSDLVFAMVTYDPSSPHPHPIQTAVELLPIADAEISAAALDFIYQHTLLPSNSALFCARPDLVHILRVVCSKLHFGAKRETLEVSIPMPDSEGARYVNAQPPRFRVPVRAEGPVEIGPRFDGEEERRWMSLPDPQRTLAWMRHTFEGHADGEVTQVVLWHGYRAQFNYGDNPSLLVAGEVIKLSSEAYPQAMPMVTEGVERKFIIKGLRIRDREIPQNVYACRWRSCHHPVGPTTPASLYWHLHHTHIAPHSPSSCCWSSCTYTSTQSNPLLRTNELSLHVRTHMPSFRAATGHETPSSTDVERSGIVVPLGNRMKYDRYHAQLDAASEITGLGYLACLVLRNVSRTVKIALDNPAGGASVKLLAGGEPSIFESLSAAQEGGTTTDPILQKLEKVDYAPAKRGAEALSALEDRLVSTALEDFGLGKILGEVLLVVTTCRGVTSKA